MEFHILSWVTFFPLIGIALILIAPRQLSRWIALATGFGTVILGVVILGRFDGSIGAMGADGIQMLEQMAWIPSLGIDYRVGVDGISILMVLLTQLIALVGIVASWNIDKSPKGYYSLYLLLQAGMTGVFVSLDFVLFYVFWEVMLLPMYFLIGIWGGPRKEYAAIKFFLYTLFGSVLMLLAIISLYINMKVPSFNMLAMMDPAAYRVDSWLVSDAGTWLFGFAPKQLVWLAFYIGFAIKIPAFPFHTWLPDAHVEAPTPISVILAGVLLKMGTYGILRVNFQMMPEVTLGFLDFIAILGLVNIIYGALAALAQKDLKSLIAYSSISHMGFVMLGMASLGDPAGLNGAMLQMFNHGCITGMLFLLVGIIYDRAHHRNIDGFGGIWVATPVYTGFVALAWFAAVGLPGLSGFISEFLIFVGAFKSHQFLAILAITGIVLGAAYMLWALQRIWMGPLNPKYESLPEITWREIATLVPLAIIVIFVGVYPAPVLDLIGPTMGSLYDYLNTVAIGGVHTAAAANF